MWRSRTLALAGFMTALGLASPAVQPEPVIPAQSAVRAHYGAPGLARVQRWEALMSEQQGQPVVKQLAAVNDFFNQLGFVDDINVWHQEDYWATPVEFLGMGRGDCEDFAMAKYQTLLELGVPDDQLRLHYVKYIPYDQYHMVVSWAPTPRQMPLILDNIDETIQPAASRRDLTPIYSFNGSNLWTSTASGQDTPVGPSSRLSRWEDWLSRTHNGLMRKS